MKNIEKHWKKTFSKDKNVNKRIEFLYLPILKQILSWKKAFIPKGPLVIGINGTQGIGKSTLTKALVEAFRLLGINAISISIDDFYLTRKAQIKLSTKYASNQYLQARGYPGTHDIKLGVETLKNLISIKKSNLKIPVYDKSLHTGKGDRLPKDKWNKIKTPVDIILFEGWMLGFMPDKAQKATNFSEINGLLEKYKVWYKFIDAFICLVPKQIEYVLEWRVEAEKNMKLSGKQGMTDEEVLKYALRFLPAYRMYLPGLVDKAPIDGPQMNVVIAKNRLPAYSN